MKAVVCKRMLDLIGAGAGLALLSPLILAAAAAVKLSSRGPILFRQLRLGRNGVPFEILKFRSMHQGAPDLRNQDGSTFSGDNDPRVTPVGRWLRATSVDELPQLWNVLRGDMSLVGPRPDQCNQLPLYLPEERTKLAVRPGLTGLAQISGRNRISWEQRKRLDCQYVETWSLQMDLEILLRTIPYVLLRKNVNGDQIEPNRVSR
jgi:lipopolysaccharide/colanic/teichoic acid biosynthesis glycosyltransferase